MVEREAAREAEPLQYEIAPDHWYEDLRTKRPAARKEVATQGEVVLKGSKRPWQLARQGLLKMFLPYLPIPEFKPGDPALAGITMFHQQIPVRSGKHRHQGGLAIFVVEGEGYTIVDGVKHPWKAGDLILLPIKPDGVEHQHFNTYPKPSRWMAIIGQRWDLLGGQLEQVEESPLWRKEYEEVYKAQ